MIEPSSKSVTVFAIAVLVACAIGGIGFVLGRDSAEPQPVQQESAKETKRLAQARKAGYERGFAAGKRAADRDQAGDRADESRVSDRDALAVDDFDLQPGGYYIVRVAEGGSGAVVGDYAPMEAGISYGLCSEYGVCRRAGAPGS